MKSKLPYRLVAFDLDNTTLVRGEMTAQTKNALRALHDKGVVTVAATGRHITLIPNTIRRSADIDYILCVTGSSLYHVHSREMTYLYQMTSEQSHLAVDICKSAGGRLNLVTRKIALAEKSAFRSFLKSSAVRGKSDHKPSFKQVLRVLRMYAASSLMDDANNYLNTHPLAVVEKIDAFFDTDTETHEAVRLLLESGSFEVAESSRYLEITAKNCTKGSGLQRLYERLGFTADDAIAFGDSGNDLSMADHAALFVAMGNAEPAVLQRAGRIAPDVYTDGFAAVVNDVFSIEVAKKQDC